ncbi:beta-ketoacyl synthase chain length factor [bacterium]|nr:beta-ketoacyl synthase chain length factor [bacterium]
MRRGRLAGKRLPRIENVEVALPDGTLSLPVYRAEAEGLERFVAKRSLRRIDPFARMALLASYLALEDAGGERPSPERIGVVFGTGYGSLGATFAFQDSVIDFGDKCASPTYFASSVHNALAAQVSISLDVQGPCQTLTGFEQSVGTSFALALSWLREGKADQVLVGAGDEYHPVLGYALARHPEFPKTPKPPVRPLDFDTCSYLPGEGFTAFLLGRERPGERAAYGNISVEFREGQAFSTGDPASVVFVAGQGRREEGAFWDCLRQAKAGGVRLGAHASLYGSLPTGQAFETAIAALCFRDGCLYTGDGKSALEPGSRMLCVGRDGSRIVISETYTLKDLSKHVKTH